MRYCKSILVLLLSFVFFLSCSGGKKEVSYTSANTASPADTNGNSDGEEPMPAPDGVPSVPDPDGAPPVPDPNEGSGAITQHRYLIAMIGGLFAPSSLD